MIGTDRLLDVGSSNKGVRCGRTLIASITENVWQVKWWSCRLGRCGRTARNNTLMEVLVFHQTLNTLKVSYNGRYPSGTSQGKTRKIHIFPQGSNNENKLQYLVHFIHPEFLEIHYYIAKFRVRNIKQRNENTYLAVAKKDPSVSTRRILHTMVLLKHYLQQG